MEGRWLRSWTWVEVTALTPVRRSEASTQLRAAASLGALPVLNGPATEGRLLGASAVAAWVDLGSDVVVLGMREAVRLPNGIGLAASVDAGLFTHTAPGDPVVVGHDVFAHSPIAGAIIKLNRRAHDVGEGFIQRPRFVLVNQVAGGVGDSVA